ncbi:TlpA disulfide reductase family protein [Candidatus Puniceispirillum marinum]|nr:TlpA disulfide reductase family protein [Candidatus Puniceispirillum marinum]
MTALSRRQFASVIGVTLLVPFLPVSAGATPMPDVHPTPSMQAKILDVEGQAFQISDFKGIPVLVNFWATWCAPCIAELPALNQAAISLADINLVILLVSIDRGGPDKALPFLQDRGIVETDGKAGMRFGFDRKANLPREMGVSGVPTSFLLSSDQAKSWLFKGPYEWDQPEMLTHIRSLVG